MKKRIIKQVDENLEEYMRREILKRTREGLDLIGKSIGLADPMELDNEWDEEWFNEFWTCRFIQHKGQLLVLVEYQLRIEPIDDNHFEQEDEEYEYGDEIHFKLLCPFEYLSRRLYGGITPSMELYIKIDKDLGLNIHKELTKFKRKSGILFPINYN